MNECKRCKIIKPIKDFYKHKGMASGYLNVCKACKRKESSERRETKLNTIREYDRNRPNKVQRLIMSKEYRINNKEKMDKYKRDWSRKNRTKRNAHNLVARAIKKRLIERSLVCSHCTCTEKIEAHHPNYLNPLEIIWLCQLCHKKEHKLINSEKRRIPF